MTDRPEDEHVERGAAEDATDTPMTPTEEAVSEPPQQRWPDPTESQAPAAQESEHQR